MTAIDPVLQLFTYRLCLCCLGNVPQFVDITVDGVVVKQLREILLNPSGNVEIVSRTGIPFIFNSEAILYAYDLGNSYTGIGRGGMTIE